MSEIVDRLRLQGENAMRQHLSLGMHKLCTEAADEIERLYALVDETARDRENYNGAHQRAFLEVERLREVLKPFAEAAGDLETTDRDNYDIWEAPCAMNITYGHLRAARAAIAEQGE